MHPIHGLLSPCDTFIRILKIAKLNVRVQYFITTYFKITLYLLCGNWKTKPPLPSSPFAECVCSVPEVSREKWRPRLCQCKYPPRDMYGIRATEEVPMCPTHSGTLYRYILR